MLLQRLLRGGSCSDPLAIGPQDRPACEVQAEQRSPARGDEGEAICDREVFTPEERTFAQHRLEAGEGAADIGEDLGAVRVGDVRAPQRREGAVDLGGDEVSVSSIRQCAMPSVGNGSRPGACAAR